MVRPFQQVDNMKALTSVTTISDSLASTGARTLSWTGNKNKLYLVLQLFVSNSTTGGYTAFGNNDDMTNIEWSRRISKAQNNSNSAYHAHRILLVKPTSNGTCTIKFTGTTSYGRFFYSVYEFSPEVFI